MNADSSRLRILTQQHPEWRAWLALFAEAVRVLDEPVWTEIEIRPRGDRLAAAPLLDGGELVIDSRSTRAWVRRLLKVAAKDKGLGVSALMADALSGVDAFALLEAAAGQHHARIRTLVEPTGMDFSTVQAIAQLAVMPLLQGCRQRLAPQVPETWPHGYCPVCGAWPVLAELRGLERARRLRCGRCGADWTAAWLRCTYCGEGGHQRLGFLLPEGREETHKVEICGTCLGYVKTRTMLQGSAASAVILEDLATVELDVAALERGYARPQRPGYLLNFRLVERPRRWRPFLTRNS
ncbi:MAG: formate dehydrogenase accessory protein FdhE [Candidatus Binatia bacterium]